MATGIGNAGPLLIIAVYTVVIAIAVTFFMSNYERYALLVKAVNWLSGTVGYALKGFSAAVAIAAVIAPAYIVATAQPSSQRMLGYAAATIVSGYFGLVALGYVADIAWERIATKHEKATGNRPFENWGEADGSD